MAIIDASRRIDWSNAGVQGGIPNSASMPIFVTRSPGVSLATLNADLAACPPGQVVKLNAGTYTFAGSIEFGQNVGVVLKGAGPGSTFLVFNAHAGGRCITIGEETINRIDPPAGQIKNWTAGYTKGTTVITLNSTSGLSVGHILALDQLNDNDLVDDDVQEGCTYCGRDSGERCQAQYVRITNISGNNVTIEPGLYMSNWSGAQSPQAFYWTQADTSLCALEEMTVTSNVGSGIYSLYFSQAQNCWVKNVTFLLVPEAAVATNQCKNIEVRRVSMLSSQTSDSQSYGVIWFMCSDGLMIDCISDGVTGSMNYAPQAQGCVVAYNYIVNNPYGTDNSWDIAGLASHDGHVCMNLAEGNWTNKIGYDSLHGTASHNTDFRNYYHGHQPGRVNNTVAYFAQQRVKFNNIVGNILGTTGFHTFYKIETLAEFSPHFNDAIFRFGEGDANDGIPFDTTVSPSMYIHGNWDAVNNTQTWDAGNADHTLPNSLFLPSKPAFFASLAWPPFDPANPATHNPERIPAGYRHINGTEPPPDGGDVVPPTITITSPTAGTSYNNGAGSSITMSGTASDDVGLSSVTWVNDRGGSGTATGTTSWSFTATGLSSGVNNITVTATDTSSNAATDALAVTYTPAGGGSLSYTVIVNPTKGVLSGTAPNLTYTPTTGATGFDSFVFKCNDGVADSAPATVVVYVAPTGNASVANSQGVRTPQDTARAIVLTGSGGTLTYTVLANPSKGALSGTAPNLTYTPTTGAVGFDSFIFKVNNGSTDSLPATVSVVITPVNSAPIADTKSVRTAQNTAVGVVLTGSGGTLSYTVLANPSKGALSGTAPNLTYTPTTGATGFDSFIFKVNNGSLDSLPTTIPIFITPSGTAPLAYPQAVQTPQNTASSITLTGTVIA